MTATPPTRLRAKIARLLPEDDDRTSIVERVAGALGWSEAVADPTETFWAVRKLLEAAAAERPLVVLFEDVHWGEPTFLELVERLAGSIRDAPVLIVATARADLLDARPDFGREAANAIRIELQPLSGDDSRVLIERLIGDTGVGPDLSQRVVTGAEGNPLFVEEVVRMLVDEHRLERDEAGLSRVRGPSAVSTPPTIHALLAARLDRLDPAERAVVEAAAVIGRSFAGEAVVEMLREDDRSELDGHLRALVRKQLIQPDGARFAGEPTFSFEHVLIRDVAYRGSLKAVRADLHERFADWLERTAGERAGEYEEILGHHLEQAHRYLAELGPLDQRGRELAVRAAARLGSSGRRALARGDIPPAVSLLERAVSLLPDDDPARHGLELKLGIALAETGQLSRAGALLQDRIESERRGSAFVLFQDGTGKQHVVNLDEPDSPITIGRRPDNHIALTWDHDVSRLHAELHRGPERWTLVDEQSRNGSFVNGQRITDRHELRNGDVLRFGDTVVLFRAPEQERRPAVSVGPDQATHFGKRPDHPAGRGRSIMGHVSGHPPADGSDLKARIEAERAGRPFLLYKDGHGRQQLFSFEADMTHASVGRGQSSDLVLDWDEQVSRLHAQLERVEEDWTVVDDGLSRNGTFLNGERLSGRRRLTDGDTLSFGGTTVTFRARRRGAGRGRGGASTSRAPSAGC